MQSGPILRVIEYNGESVEGIRGDYCMVQNTAGVFGYSQCDVIRNSRGDCPNFPFVFQEFGHPGRTIRHVRRHMPQAYWGIPIVM